MARLRAGLGRLTRRLGGGGVGLLVLVVIGVIVFIWVATGFYRVGPGEQAVLRRFGEPCGTPFGPCGGIESSLIVTPGLKWWWPGPIGRKDVVKVTETRRLQLGFRGGVGGPVTPVEDEALMISGDLNVVDVHMVVQYTIGNLVDFLFRVNDPGERERGIPSGKPDGQTLKDAAEAALRLVVGQRSIEDVLTERRAEVEEGTKRRLEEILSRYHTGVRIQSIQLQQTKAPEQVFDAFEDVLRARQEKETKINEALAYQNAILPRAQGNAERIKREAEAFAQSRVARAQGEAAQFTSILKEYQKSKEVTRRRLYLEAMEDILPGVTKFIVAPEAESIIILGGKEGLTPLPIGPKP